MSDDRSAISQSERQAKATENDKKRKTRDAQKATSAANRKGGKRARLGGSGGGNTGGSRGGGKGRSRKSLRAAATRAGRGIVVRSCKNGRGFKGLIGYATDPKKSHEVVFSNCGNDPQAALRTMIRCAELRPSISQPVGHITLALPPKNGHGEQRWTDIVSELKAQIGIDDTFPVFAVRHGDTSHDHVHLIFSRISINGQVHDQRNIGMRCGAAEPILEQKFDLPIVHSDEFKTHGHISKNEIEMGIRTKVLPPRLQISSALEVASQGHPTVRQFVERLQAASIGVKANVSKTTGKMSGFSFIFAGIAFSASKIDKKYGWASLEKDIDYEQARDTEFLVGLDGSPGTASHDLAAASAIIGGLNRAVALVSPPAADSTGLDAVDPAAIDRTSKPHEQNSEERILTLETPASRAGVGFDGADRNVEPLPYRSGDRVDELAIFNDVHDFQTSLTATTTEGALQNEYYEHYNRYESHPRQLARLSTAATLAGLPNLSPLGLAADENRGEIVLQDHAPGNLADGPNRPRRGVQRGVGASARASKITRPAVTLPPGFSTQRPLDLSQQKWVDSLPNRIAAASPSTGQRVLLNALINNNDRVIAIRSNFGYMITTKSVTDEQLSSLLIDAGNIEQPIKITGTPDFCQRADTLASKKGLVVTHDHQVSEIERKAAQLRHEERQREALSENKDSVPVPK